jgi:hypothetical protein
VAESRTSHPLHPILPVAREVAVVVVSDFLAVLGQEHGSIFTVESTITRRTAYIAWSLQKYHKKSLLLSCVLSHGSFLAHQ